MSDDLAAQIAAEHGPKRSSSGRGSEWDFWSGPLAAAVVAFRDFETLRFEHVPRSGRCTSSIFGAVVFVGVLVGPTIVELAGYAHDPDHWASIEDGPDG